MVLFHFQRHMHLTLWITCTSEQVKYNFKPVKGRMKEEKLTMRDVKVPLLLRALAYESISKEQQKMRKKGGR